MRRQIRINQNGHGGDEPWGATDSVGGGNHTDVTPILDKSAALGAKSRYHCFLQLSQLKPWNFKSNSIRVTSG